MGVAKTTLANLACSLVTMALLLKAVIENHLLPRLLSPCHLLDADVFAAVDGRPALNLAFPDVDRQGAINTCSQSFNLRRQYFYRRAIVMTWSALDGARPASFMPTYHPEHDSCQTQSRITNRYSWHQLAVFVQYPLLH